jgi:GntR family transcriptional regulator
MQVKFPGTDEPLHVIWNDNTPIYQQLRDRIVTLIIEGQLQEGEAVPSVRQVSSDYSINHLTVAKAYQELMAEGLLEKKRGIGIFVLTGARKKLLEQEQKKFLNNEFPELLKRIRSLGISRQQIAEMIATEMKGQD